MDRITEKIADYAAATKFEHLSAEAVHAAIQRLIDSLGCAVGAHDCEPAAIGRRLANGQTPGKYAGRTLCFGDTLPAEAATFINSAMIRNFDFNDRFPGGHPSDWLGALLALAGARGVDGRRFLASMIVVYEIFARLSDSTRLSRRGWDQGYAISVATAAGVSNLLQLPLIAAANAIGIAATSSLPLRLTRSGALTSWKNVATAYAARNGDPHSASAQFFINVKNNDFLNYPGQDGWGYAVFGKVVDGMDVVTKIAKTPTGSGGPFRSDVPKQPVVIESMTVVGAKK